MFLAGHNTTSTPQVLVRYQTRGGKKEYLYLSSSIFLYLLFLGLFLGQRSQSRSHSFHALTDYTGVLVGALRIPNAVYPYKLRIPRALRYEPRRPESPTAWILWIVVPTIFHERSTVYRAIHRLMFHGYLFLCEENIQDVSKAIIIIVTIYSNERSSNDFFIYTSTVFLLIVLKR